MYSLVGSDGIVVIDLAQRKTVQYFDLSSIGSRQGYMGMAVWPAE